MDTLVYQMNICRCWDQHLSLDPNDIHPHLLSESEESR